MQEADLAIPVSWQDQSMHMFRIPPGAGTTTADASFVVTRDAQAAKRDAVAYAEEQQAAIKDKLAEYRLLALRRSKCGEIEIALVDYLWSANDVVLHQRQACVPTPEGMLTLTLTARMQDLEALEAAWNDVLGSLKPVRHGPPGLQP